MIAMNLESIALIKNVDYIIPGFTNEEIRFVKGNRKTNFK